MIVVALNYWQGEEHPKAAGRIARYAWGDDYHDLMKGKLEALLGRVRELHDGHLFV